MSSIIYVNPLGQILLSELESLFTLVGDVRSMQARDLTDSAVGTRFGVIEMETPQQAADCIERFNGHQLLGHRLAVTSSEPVVSPPNPSLKSVRPRTKKERATARRY